MGTEQLEDAAGAAFRRSVGLAREQGALFWALRGAIELARQGDGALLRSAYGRFTEGFEAADLRAARRLLGD